MAMVTKIEILKLSAPAFIEKYNKARADLVTYNATLKLGGLEAREVILLTEWINWSDSFIKDNIDHYQKCVNVMNLTDEQINDIVKDLQDLCQTQSQPQQEQQL